MPTSVPALPSAVPPLLVSSPLSLWTSGGALIPRQSQPSPVTAYLSKGQAVKASLPSVPAGPPAPPQDVTVQAGATPATVQVSWKPPVLTTTGLSNGANVTGYGVYAKGQRVSFGCTRERLIPVQWMDDHWSPPHILPDPQDTLALTATCTTTPEPGCRMVTPHPSVHVFPGFSLPVSHTVCPALDTSCSSPPGLKVYPSEAYNIRPLQ